MQADLVQSRQAGFVRCCLNDAVNAHRKQHVWGILNLKSGDPVSIRDKIIGSPTIETQITEDSDVFNISCL